jgi:hypothetical protein
VLFTALQMKSPALNTILETVTVNANGIGLAFRF